MQVRGFKAGDAGEIVRLHKNSGEWFEDLPVDEDFINAASFRDDFRFFIAESEGTVVGFAGALLFLHVGRAELGPICVDEIYRKKGVGSNLVGETLSYLQRLNVRRVIVKVKSGNQKAQEFFKSCGFQTEAKLEKYTVKGEDIIQMVFFA